MTSVCLNKRGFTLIEFLVAIVILMVGMLGLLQVVNLAYSTNLQNDLRNTAVVLADEEISRELKKGYDNVINASFRNYTVSRPMLNAMKNYSVNLTGTPISSGTDSSKQVSVLVIWRYKKMRYDHGISAVVSKHN
jgi:type IV pilus assembly protein PilV